MLKFDHDKELNVLNLGKKLSMFSKIYLTKKRLKRLITTICTFAALLLTLYGSSKVHMPVIDRCPFFSTHSLAINTPSYEPAKFLVPLLTPLTSNDYTIRDSFSFSEVPFSDCACHITSFDIEPLFTFIPLGETINISADKLFKNNTKVNN